jgi:mannose-6-phosphate isomerase-like protein (cupin superfamily)
LSEAILMADLDALVSAAAEAYATTGDAAATALARSLRPPAGGYRLPQGNEQPALACLGTALDALPAGPLARPLRAVAPLVPWTVGDFKMPASFAGRSAYVEILGPDGFAGPETLRFGLYVQTPESFYPPHSHAAEELYYVLSGTARWQKDDGEPAPRSPGTLIVHGPWQRHAMRTAAEPLLAMWAWTGDLNTESYRVDGR